MLLIQVGLMRSGRLLAESPPLHLMETHGLPTLEDVFLKLCQQDHVGDVEEMTSQTSTNSRVKVHAESAPRVS